MPHAIFTRPRTFNSRMLRQISLLLLLLTKSLRFFPEGSQALVTRLHFQNHFILRSCSYELRQSQYGIKFVSFCASFNARLIFTGRITEQNRYLALKAGTEVISHKDTNMKAAIFNSIKFQLFKMVLFASFYIT